MALKINMPNSKLVATGILAVCAVAISSLLSSVSSLWIYPYPRALLLNMIQFSMMLFMAGTVLLLVTLALEKRGRNVRSLDTVSFWVAVVMVVFNFLGATLSLKGFIACNVATGKNDICSISIENASQCQLKAISEAANYYQFFYLSKVTTPFASCTNA